MPGEPSKQHAIPPNLASLPQPRSPGTSSQPGVHSGAQPGPPQGKPCLTIPDAQNVSPRSGFIFLLFDRHTQRTLGRQQPL